MNVLNLSEWAEYGVYSFDCASVWCVCRVYISTADAALAAAELLTSPTNVSAPLTDLNLNDVDALTTALATELDRKRRCAESTTDAQSKRVPGSDSKTETEEEDNNYTGTASIRDSDLPKNNKQNSTWSVFF